MVSYLFCIFLKIFSLFKDFVINFISWNWWITIIIKKPN